MWQPQAGPHLHAGMQGQDQQVQATGNPPRPPPPLTRLLRCAKMVSRLWLPHSSLPSSMDSAKDMSEGSESTPRQSRKPTKLGYVVRLYTCVLARTHACALWRPAIVAGWRLLLGWLRQAGVAQMQQCCGGCVCMINGAWVCVHVGGAGVQNGWAHLEAQVHRVGRCVVGERVPPARGILLKQGHSVSMPACARVWSSSRECRRGCGQPCWSDAAGPAPMHPSALTAACQARCGGQRWLWEGCASCGRACPPVLAPIPSAPTHGPSTTPTRALVNLHHCLHAHLCSSHAALRPVMPEPTTATRLLPLRSSWGGMLWCRTPGDAGLSSLRPHPWPTKVFWQQGSSIRWDWGLLHHRAAPSSRGMVRGEGCCPAIKPHTHVLCTFTRTHALTHTHARACARTLTHTQHTRHAPLRTPGLKQQQPTPAPVRQRAGG